ncbi:Hypothetical protein PFR_JS25-2_4 [Propionibacterium freudenreichii]|nr:Hypothetical protein PFR_JS25-2_4 [Propionibacterium freudenreichii]
MGARHNQDGDPHGRLVVHGHDQLSALPAAWLVRIVVLLLAAMFVRPAPCGVAIIAGCPCPGAPQGAVGFQELGQFWDGYAEPGCDLWPVCSGVDHRGSGTCTCRPPLSKFTIAVGRDPCRPFIVTGDCLVCCGLRREVIARQAQQLVVAFY